MKRVHQVSGKTIVLVTHDIEEALLLANRIVLLDQGKVVQEGSPLELLANPANEFVVEFFGRSDIGIKLLSLQVAQGLARAEPAGPGPALPAHTSLREVVSFMALRRVSQVNLTDASGGHAGVVHSADIFAGGKP
jgi:osmoprotectant transport system ATP-binding protein